MNHIESSQFASLAEIAFRKSNFAEAKDYYRKAGELEVRALGELDHSKVRTFGVTVVSAVSLFYKAHDFERAEQLSHMYLGQEGLPPFASEQLRDLLQTIWNDKALESHDIQFTHGEVLVSVSGGEVVTGGAPLELVLTKVNDISKYFFRTIELLLEKPLRKKGNPEPYIQQQCRPWLFQAPAGSYQFAVRVQKPMQPSFFEEDVPKVEEITSTFIRIVNASSLANHSELERLVPDKEYRETFLKMTRNLAPTGKTFDKLEIKPTGDTDLEPVVLIPESRNTINKAIKKPMGIPKEGEREGRETRFLGLLRGLHLDKDWIEVSVADGDAESHIRIFRTGEVIDDIVGPMVNRQVIVDTIRTPSGQYHFRDIQIDE